MRLNLVMAGMHVLGRIGFFKPYTFMIDRVLKMLDTACEEEWGIPWQESLPDMELEMYA